jgi:hypothetical protein
MQPRSFCGIEHDLPDHLEDLALKDMRGDDGVPAAFDLCPVVVVFSRSAIVWPLLLISPMRSRWSRRVVRSMIFARSNSANAPSMVSVNLSAAAVAVQRETRTIPIVIANLADPVASSIVAPSTKRRWEAMA